MVGLSLEIEGDDRSNLDTLEELRELLETAGGECMAMILQNKRAPDTRTFIGSGKVKEVLQMVQDNEADIVIFDNELSPSQLRVLEEELDVKVLDRSALILDIFANRAVTNEGKLQVELAQYKYLLPRLMGFGKDMSRLKAGICARGPGETKLETDRRNIRNRIDRIERELQDVIKVRDSHRRQRRKFDIPFISLVGYTNAGKSTLLNMLTDAGIQANDRLFDTLDPTTKKFRVSDTLEVFLSDTVGFIRKLPHHLIRAFKATLEEVVYSDLIIHVVDVSSDLWEGQYKTVNKVLAEINADNIPVITVFNKIDNGIVENGFDIEDFVYMSAKSGEGKLELLETIERVLNKNNYNISVVIPFSDGWILDIIHKDGQVLSKEYVESGTRVNLVCDDKLLGRVKEYIV